MRNPFVSHTDFGFLKGVIQENPKAMPSNLDMIFERNGHFLIGEWKREDEEISTGQKILLKALALNEKFTVLIINGHSDHIGTAIENYYEVTQSKLIVLGNGIDSLKDYINTWYKFVNNR
jgi:hypothetical protein